MHTELGKICMYRGEYL